MLHEIPEGLEKFSASPMFDQETTPDALKQNHQVKAGVWGKLVVHEGSLEYIVSDAPSPARLIEAPGHAIIEPQQLHCVKLVGSVRFQVEFYREPKQAAAS